MRQGLDRFFRIVSFIFPYLILGLVNSGYQSNIEDYDENENLATILVTVEENLSTAIDLFDFENDTDDQEKFISRSIPTGICAINYSIPFQQNSLMGLSACKDQLLLSQMDLPPPTSI